MSALTALSILLRLTAMAWSLVLLRRQREWRMALLTAMLGLMAVRQLLAMRYHLAPNGFWAMPVHGLEEEIAALLVSILAFVFVILLDRLLHDNRSEKEENRRAQESLQRKAARQRVMLEQLPAVVWTADRALRFTSSLGSGLKGLGLESNQVVGMSLNEYFGTDDADFQPILATRRALEGESVAYELEWDKQSFQCLVEPLRDANETIVGIVGVAMDVTELKVSESALRDTEEGYRSFIANSTEGIWRLEIEGGIDTGLPAAEQVTSMYENGFVAECNQAFAHMFGVAAAGQMVGRPTDDVLPSADAANLALLQAFVSGGYTLSNAEIREQNSDGEVHHFVTSLTGILEGDRLVRIWGTQREMTAQTQAEEALRASEERYRQVFEQSQIPIFISTPEGALVDLNPAGLRLLGLEKKEEYLGVDVAREFYVDPMERQAALRELAEKGSIRDFPLRIKRKDGSRLLVLETATAVRGDAGEVVAFRGMLQDVTQQRALEEQLQQAQRMEAVGRLAEGVAHDFNNLLTVINGQCDLLLARMESDSPHRQGVEATKKAGHRAADLTQRLLVLSRRRIRAARLLDLNEVISGVEELLRRTLGERIELEIHPGENLRSVRADAAQMDQVLLNLAINARDAMPQGGRLTLTTDESLITEGHGVYPAKGVGETWVRLTVEDTGHGIDSEIRDRIFEPFFTTKGTPEATGFGLSTVYGIIEQSGGQIRVMSEPGEGARFEILLPPDDLPADEPVARSSDVAPAEPSGETVLLVEDDEPVRALLARFLTGIGYKVLTAQFGKEALEIAESAEGTIDCLIADLILPDLSGTELAAQLLRKQSDLEVLFMSGYGQDPASTSGDGPVLDEHNFLQKPFATEDLALRLRRLLDG